ncbi:hypothetical protein MVEN_01140500 [Mycena venus]|uniref:Uncharacterized protein n=1 Tax=Mycena venus TaxID=2733690 RepID=A0A8H6Y9A2_9AGAR|nr:hypothetical protein MVEN_01140500 [Mycena venus]
MDSGRVRTAQTTGLLNLPKRNWRPMSSRNECEGERRERARDWVSIRIEAMVEVVDTVFSPHCTSIPPRLLPVDVCRHTHPPARAPVKPSKHALSPALALARATKQEEKRLRGVLPTDAPDPWHALCVMLDFAGGRQSAAVDGHTFSLSATAAIALDETTDVRRLVLAPMSLALS